MTKKYQEFNVGHTGSGTIDLTTGELTFIHQTTDVQSTILPIGVSHVYQSKLSKKADSLYGRGWQLNLNQSLHKVSPDDPNDTRYIYTDGSGTKHEFKEKYFYKKDKEKNYYLPNTTIKIRPNDIKIDLDGRMWLIVNLHIEVFAELITDSGLILHLRPKGFEGSKKIETRHEELVRVENEIKSIERQIEDLEDQIKQNSNLTPSIEVDNHRFNTLRELQKHIEIENARVERQAITDFNRNIFDQTTLMTRQQSLRNTTGKSVGGPIWTIIPSGLSNDNAENASFNEMRLNCWTYNNHSARMLDSIQTRMQFQPEATGSAINNQLRRTRAIAHYQRLYQEDVERLQQDIQNISANIESRNWTNQQRNVEVRSYLLNLQEEFKRIQNEFEEKRLSLLLERWNEDLDEVRIQLSRRQHLRTQLINWLPVNYIIGDNILGFNEEGNLVLIFDNYDNQVAIVYEDDRIVRVIDAEDRTIEFEYINNRLDHIKDFQERITYFKYDLENRLEEIVYPDESSSLFEYNTLHLMTDIIPPSKIGKRLIIDDSHRVAQVLNRSKAVKISTDGIEEGAEQTEDIIKIVYDSVNKNTVIINSKTQEQITYFFKEDGEIIHEHLQGKFEQHFITYYESEEHEVVINEEIASDLDIVQLKAKHLKWVNGPSSLPSFEEKLTWQVTYLDGEGNPIKRIFSETSLPSDEAIRQKVEETFTYKHFIDGRLPLLVRSNTIITTTNKANRHLSKDYFYNKEGSLIRTVSLPDGLVEEAGYNNKGLVINSRVYHRSNPDKGLVEKAEINKDGQMISSYDESGRHKTTYDYLKKTNIINKVTDPNGRHTVFGRDFATNKINSMSSTSNNERNATTYTYTADFLTKLASANTTFKYIYDKQGRKTAVYVNKETDPYVTYEYSFENHNANNNMGTVKCDVVKMTYASKEVYISYTDIFGRLLSVHYKGKDQNEKVILTNFYEDEKVIKTLDYKTNETILFEYDIRGNVIKEVVKGLFDDKVEEIPGQYLSISQDININGSIDRLTYEIDKRNQVYKFDYDEEEKLTQISLPSKDSLKIKTDDLGRQHQSDLVSNDKRIVSDELAFLQYADRTTNLVNSHVQRIGEDKFNKTHYTYDKMGNISEVRESGLIILRYKYDDLNRLIREDNKNLDKSLVFEYDNNGNILLKRENSYTLDNLLTESTITNYTYLEKGDQLRLFNDERFVYDALGNPTTYRDNNLKWSHLRNLESFNDIEFKYNAANLRVYKDYQKEIDGELIRFESRYQWANDKLISETKTATTNSWKLSDKPVGEHTHDVAITTTTTTLDFLYGANGKIGFILNNEDPYYYVKNIQGDVLKIIDTKANVVAKYAYDAWGNHKIITSIDGIAELNPIRYRSYYWDEETNLYYLKSRYYDPQVGRFINMDALSYVDPDNIGGLNLYAYCANNPVMNIDPDGTRWWRWVVSGLQIVVGVALVATGIGAGFGAALIVSGGAMMTSNILNTAGVNSRLSMHIQSGLNILAGVTLMFVPGLQGFGASMIGAGVLGIAGGYISEALGGSFELGWSIGSIVGSIAGAGIYNAAGVTRSASQAGMTGKRFGTHIQTKPSGARNVVHFNWRGEQVLRIDRSHTHFVRGFWKANPHAHSFRYVWNPHVGKRTWTEFVRAGGRWIRRTPWVRR